METSGCVEKGLSTTSVSSGVCAYVCVGGVGFFFFLRVSQYISLVTILLSGISEEILKHGYIHKVVNHGYF